METLKAATARAAMLADLHSRPYVVVRLPLPSEGNNSLLARQGFITRTKRYAPVPAEELADYLADGATLA